MLAAVAGRAASRVFQRTNFKVVTTEWNIAEVGEYLPTFAERYGVPVEILVEALALLPARRYRSSYYSSHLAAASSFLRGRDDDDISLAALALKLRIPIWSNDNDFKNFPYGMYTTAQLLKALHA